MNNSINNSPINFQAKMILFDDLENKVRLKKIAKEFEAKTAKKYPQYEVQLGRPGYPPKRDNLEIAIDRGISDYLIARVHILKKDATEKLMELSDNEIIQKLIKLLGLVKKHDNLMDNINKDVVKIESKYGVELDGKLFDEIYDAVGYKVNSEILEKISKDSIFSDYAESQHIFN